MTRFLDKRFTLILFLPTIILFALLIIYPMCYGVYVSLFDTNLLNKWDFVGFKNFTDLISNKAFMNSLGVNLKYIVAVVSGHFIIGTGLAVLINKQIKGRVFFRCILMLPWLIPEVVFAVLFKWILNPQYGVFNFTMMKLGLISDPLSWLGNTSLALPSVIAISIIKGYPFVMIMVLSALQTVPADIYEAAEIDGCNAFQRFRLITLPSIIPVLTVALILDTVNWFKHYTMISILTGGGPAGSTSLVSVTIYKTAFGSFKFGMAGAMAVVVFIICYIFSWIYRRATNEKE
jgi:multiple sugar transport system permease protein